MAISTYDELVADLNAKGGVSCYNMKTLREIHGAGKLGTTVIANIANELGDRGVGIFPELSLFQWSDVRLYIKSSSVGKIVESVRTINLESDAALRGFSDAPNRNRNIARLKEIVSEL